MEVPAGRRLTWAFAAAATLAATLVTVGVVRLDRWRADLATGDATTDSPELAGALALVGLGFAIASAAIGLVAGRRRRRAAELRARSHAADRARRWFERVTEQAHDDLIVIGPDRELIWASSTLGTGTTITDTDQLLALLHRDDRERVVADVLATLDGGPSTRSECRLRSGGDTWRTNEVLVTNLLDDPLVGGVVLTIRDVTSDRAARAESTRLAALHEFLTAYATEVMIRLDDAGRIEYVSRAVEALIEHLPDDLVGVELDLLVAEQHRSTIRAAMHAARREGQPRRVDVALHTGVGQVEATWVSAGIRFVVEPDRVGYHVSLLDVTARRSAERALEAAESTQRQILDTLTEGVVLTDRETGVVAVNRAAGELLGVSTGPEHSTDQLANHSIALLEADGTQVPAGDTPSRRVFRTGRAAHGRQLQVCWPDGTAAIYAFTSVPSGFDADGAPTRVLTTVQDVTTNVLAQRQLAAERKLLDTVLSSVSTGVVALDARGRITMANEAFRELVGMAADAEPSFIELATHLDMQTPDGRDFDVSTLTLAVHARHVVDTGVDLRDARGRARSVLLSASPMHHGGRTPGVLVTVTDVTALRAAERELRRLATIDPLTELPNRRSLEERLGETLARERRSPDRLAALFVDLDGFKSVNDRYGHETGDELLVAVADRLRRHVRDGDLVTRLGGDEFVVVIEADDALDVADTLATRIRDQLRAPFDLDAATIVIDASIGAARARVGDDATTLLARADHAMYTVKHGRTDVARPLVSAGDTG